MGSSARQLLSYFYIILITDLHTNRMLPAPPT